MREIKISEMSIIEVGGGMTENQCIAGFAGAGFVIGAILGRSAGAGMAGATYGTIVGGLICNEIIGKEQDSGN